MDQSDISTQGKKASIGLVLGCMVFQFVPVGAVALFLPRIREQLNLTFTQAGSLTAGLMLAYGIMQLPAGFMGDRFNPRRLFLIGSFGTAALLVAFGFLQQYWQAVADLAVSGVFMSFMFLPGAVLLMKLFPRGRQASVLSVLLSSLFLGQILLSLIGPVVSAGSNWRPVFMYFGGAGLLVSFAYLVLGKDPPKDNGGPRISVHDIVRVLKSRFMWLCNGMQFVRLAVTFGITSWTPAYLMVERGLPLQAAGLVVVGQYVAMVCGTMLGGFLSDKWHKPATVVAVSYAVLLVTVLMLTLVHDTTLIIVVLMFNSLFLSSTSGSLYAMPIERLGSTARGTITGVGNLFANFGGFVFTFLLGFLKDATGLFQSGFFAMAIACCAGLVFIALAAVSRRDYLKSRSPG